MKRRQFIVLTAAAVLAAQRRANGQGSERLRHVAIFSALPIGDPVALTRLAALSSRLKDLGWVEGRNIAYERILSNVDPALRAAVAKEVIARQPDIILTSSTPDTAALLKETRSIPIVFSTSADPVGSGFVQSLARPGGNATGFTNSHASMGGKWLEILKEIAPRTTRVGVLFNPDTAPRNGDFYLGPMRELAQGFGVEVFPAPVRDVAAITSTIAAYAGEPPGGFVITPDSFTVSKVTGEITGRRVGVKLRVHSFTPNGQGISASPMAFPLRRTACLTDDEARALALIGRQVEDHYDAPQDIEWALLGDSPGHPALHADLADRIVLLQSRPETVWAARDREPIASPQAKASDHVLARFRRAL